MYASIAATAFPDSAVLWTKLSRHPAHSVRKNENVKNKTPEMFMS
jgi:hypothetical protein